MKIALYKTSYGSQIPFENDEWIEKNPEYVRTTEIIEVTFVARPRDELIPAQIANLESERDKLIAEFTEAVNKIERRKAELLALTAPV
jgi:hypothetical protein